MIDLVLMRLAGECGSEEVCGYWFDFWDYSQYTPRATSPERWHQSQRLFKASDLMISKLF